MKASSEYECSSKIKRLQLLLENMQSTVIGLESFEKACLPKS